MKPEQIMVIAGEASGDTLAAELVIALRRELTNAQISYTPDTQPLRTGLEPRFFGAGGPRMKDAGVELAFDLTRHSVIGISDALKNYFKFRRLFNQLVKLAAERQPQIIVCVDFSGFNRRFAEAIKNRVRSRRGWFHDWQPKIVQFVSPQVWASRAERAYQIAGDYDLLLSIFPFEKDWYAQRVPQLRVEFVGHPMIDRFANGNSQPVRRDSENASIANRPPRILLLPGSRESELKRHLPVMLGALKLIRQKQPQAAAKMVLPNQSLAQLAKTIGVNEKLEIQIGDLPSALAQTDLAIASTGTVTMECAFFGVPTVTMYKTSAMTYQIAKRVVKVKSLTMPNILAGEEVFPEFIQNAATPENISSAALSLLQNDSRRVEIKTQLAKIISTLGEPGATERAAKIIAGLIK
ncbi:MAG TPA: lipid-A-disaccharide synthase [Verrucomicrobiae bacterium]|nr:lipid-A-disaccharide synthase [Verrucomicrobiae bacterium]